MAALRGKDQRRTARARWLRRALTPAEFVLWTRIRRRQLGGFKFVRQEPIGRYYADFVCRDRPLIVELDGGQQRGTPRGQAARQRAVRPRFSGDPHLEQRRHRQPRWRSRNAPIRTRKSPLTPALSPATGARELIDSAAAVTLCEKSGLAGTLATGAFVAIDRFTNICYFSKQLIQMSPRDGSLSAVFLCAMLPKIEDPCGEGVPRR